jgi:choline monooxygenase
MRSLLIDADIAKAETPPGWLYDDAAVLDHLREAAFAGAWHLLPQAAAVKAPRHILPFTLLPGCLDEPLVLTRDEASRLHCLSNTCTHRGTIVAEGEDHSPALRCRYHGRRFHLDGRLHSMPGFEGVEGFPSPRDDLRACTLARWGVLHFASLREDVPFERWIEPLARRLDFLDADALELDTAYGHDYHIAANWALYVENYLEGFHVAYVHQGSLSSLDLGAYTTELFAHGVLQVGVGKAGEVAFDIPPGHRDHGRNVVAYYFWMFPNLMLNFYPWGLSVNVVVPLSPGRTRVSYMRYLFRGADLPAGGAGGDLHRVEKEDQEVVESAQKGLRSRLYGRGRYSVLHERGPHHFHRMLATSLAGEAG